MTDCPLNTFNDPLEILDDTFHQLVLLQVSAAPLRGLDIPALDKYELDEAELDGPSP